MQAAKTYHVLRRWSGPVSLFCLLGAGNGCSADPAAEEAAPLAHTPDKRPVVLFLGDSLTAGLRLDPDVAYPAQIQRKLDAAGYPYRAVNAGVSGDTTADGLNRLDWLLRQPVAVVVLALGANDALRGLPIDHVRGNLDTLITRIREHNPDIRILVAGMRISPNYGEDYTRAFERIYVDLTDKHDVALMPFMLADVAGQPDLNLADGIHPNAAGHEIMASNVWTYLRPLLRESKK